MDNDYADIESKLKYYSTAQIIATGEYVAIGGVAPGKFMPDGVTMVCARIAGRNEGRMMPITELHNFVL